MKVSSEQTYNFEAGDQKNKYQADFCHLVRLVKENYTKAIVAAAQQEEEFKRVAHGFSNAVDTYKKEIEGLGESIVENYSESTSISNRVCNKHEFISQKV